MAWKNTAAIKPGDRFTRLTALEIAPHPAHATNRAHYWRCACECGGEVTVNSNSLRCGRTKSCGCLKREMAAQRAYERGRTNPLSVKMGAVYSSYKIGARHRGLEFGLAPNQFAILAASPCYYCGSPPGTYNRKARKGRRLSDGTREVNFHSYTGLDRVDNAVGYIPENVVPCCGRCNFAKGKMSASEFLEMVKDIYEHLLTRNKDASHHQNHSHGR